jgi:hypothetical protein
MRAVELTEVFPLPVAPMTLWRYLVQAFIKQTCHVRDSDGWLLLGGDPVGSTREHDAEEAERTTAVVM